MTTNKTVIPARACRHRNRRLRNGLAVSVAVATLILASCGGGSDVATTSPSTSASGPVSSTENSSTETPATDAPDASGDPCRLLTAAEAEAALGVAVGSPVKTEIPDSGYGAGADCAYQSVDEPAGPASVHVGLLGDRYPRDLWEQAQRAEGLAAVADVGQLAYFDGDTKLEVFDQGRWIQVQMINPEVNEVDDLVPLLSDLARIAVERV